MTELNPENGRIPGAPSRALSHRTELILFLEKFDHARRSQWQNLLSLQAEQLRLLTTLIETKRPANRHLAEPRTQ
jgi:hypothetical protein